MKKVIFLIALNCCAFFDTRSQGFAHIYQAPLLMNPSFAGSTGGARLAAVTNFGAGGFQNNYLSFDHLLKKAGIGIGGAVFSNKGLYFYNYNQSVGGLISVAPKYVLKKRDGSKRATFSPSVSLRYSTSTYGDADRWNDYSGTTQENPNLYQRDGYDIYRVTENNNFSKDIKLSAGLMYNSEKLIVGLVFSNRWVEQKYDVYKMYNDSSSLKYYSANPGMFIDGVDTTKPYFTNFYGKKLKTETFKVSIQTLDFHFSKVIKFGVSKFSIVPSLLIGVAYYNRRNDSYWGDFSFYKRNASLQFNYGKVFFGGGLAGGTDTYSGFAGYKNEKIKIMGSYNFLPAGSYISESRSFEVSVNYNLKFKKR